LLYPGNETVRAYLRLDPTFGDRKAAYPDGAFRAYIEVLCFAEQQHPRGVFRSRKLLAVLLDKRARWIGYLIENGDLIEVPTGQLVVDGWTEWQEGDWKVHERIARIRNRQRRERTPATVTNDTVPTVTPDTEPTVDTPLSGGGGSGGMPKAEAGGPTAQPDDENGIARNLRIYRDPSSSESAKRAARKYLLKNGVAA
jgi:hypothetical protein